MKMYMLFVVVVQSISFPFFKLSLKLGTQHQYDLATIEVQHLTYALLLIGVQDI